MSKAAGVPRFSDGLHEINQGREALEETCESVSPLQCFESSEITSPELLMENRSDVRRQNSAFR